ncbi:MAG: hypothetical protein ABI743_02590, partial [bacterium]
MRLVPWFGVLLAASLMLLGCQGGGPDPAAPAATPVPEAPAVPVAQHSPGFVPTGATESFITGFSGFGTIGGTINLQTLAVMVDPPARSGALGETFDVDITDFTNENPCLDCLRIEGVGVNPAGHVLVDVSLRHPFKDTSVFFTRPDLDAFDARVIAILPGSDTSLPILVYPDNATAATQVLGNFSAVVNQDGMTSHFDSRAEDPRYFNPPKGIDGNINAFKRYFVDPQQIVPFEPTNPLGWNVLPIASVKQTQTFEIDPAKFAGPTIPFVLVAEASWGVARNKALPVDDPGGRFNPKYWLPEFNQHEPWRVDVNIVSNGLTHNVGASAITFDVLVSDWQAGATVDPAYPNLGNLGGLQIASDVSRVRVAIPGVNNAGSSQTAPTSGLGTFDSPYLYQFTLQNAEGADGGSYVGLVAAEDNLNGSDAGPQRIPELGFPRQGAEIINYVGYKTFPVTVRTTNFAPQVTVTLVPEDGIIDGPGQACVSAFVTDPDAGDTHTIEWDFSYDVADGFQVEGTGVDVCHTYNDPGIFVIAVRVTDNGTPPMTTFVDDAATVKVNGFFPPFGPFDAARRDKTPSDGGQSGMGFTGQGALLMAFAGAGVGDDIFIAKTNDGVNWSAPGNISLSAAGDQEHPDLAVNGLAAMVVWEDGGALRGAISGDGGNNWQAGFLVAANGTLPAVSVTSPTTFFVAYENGGDVFLKVNAVGNLTDFNTTPVIVNDETDGLQTRPDLACDPDSDRAYLAWEDDRDDLTFGIDIWGAVATSRGTVISPNKPISDDRSNRDDTEPSLTVANTGDWVGIAYASDRFRATGDIFVSKSINQGVTWQPPVVLTAGPLATYSAPSISARSDLSAVLVAYTVSTGPSVNGVRYRVSNDGAQSFKLGVDPGAQAGVNPNPTTALQPFNGDNIIVGWTDQTDGGTGDRGQIKFLVGYDFR